MIELIINYPHKQTKGQRLTGFALQVAGWLLWSYFLFPLMALGCSFMEFVQCAQWVSLSGGYISLQETMVNYLQIVLAMLVGWIAWVGYNIVHSHYIPYITLIEPVNNSDLCQVFNIDYDTLVNCQNSRYVIVHFDKLARIIGLEGIEASTEIGEPCDKA